ncbi:MAG: prephenate dehydratase [Fluviicola sp.]
MKKTDRIAIQGIKGAFHEEAARKLFGQQIEIVECLEFQDEIKALDSGLADYAVMAIENTISGTILNNYELIRRSGVSIIGETTIQIRQHLGGVQGASLGDLREVKSHYMALNQCRDFFQRYPQIKLVESQDTALSIKNVALENLKTSAAIGSELAIKEYGLELIAKDLQTNNSNYTRFGVLQLNKYQDVGNKLSLSIILKHESGTLAKTLNKLHQLHVNLTKIESVPIVGEPFRYRFYLDLIIPDEDSFEKTIEAITPLTDELKVLGRYKSEPLKTTS